LHPSHTLRQTLRAAARSASALLVLGVALVGATGCRQDMHDQPKIKVYREADFFADRRGVRPIPEGTVARGFLQEDQHMYAGRAGEDFTNEFPFPVTREVLERGRQQYDVFCAPCHGLAGLGNGMVVQRGFRPPPSFDNEEVRNQPVGYYFDVMTNGFGAMPDYRAQVSPGDRWAIAAYIRALQFSQRANIADLPADLRQRIQNPGAADAGAPPNAGGPAH
jgi:hypothetical protein